MPRLYKFLALSAMILLASLAGKDSLQKQTAVLSRSSDADSAVIPLFILEPIQQSQGEPPGAEASIESELLAARKAEQKQTDENIFAQMEQENVELQNNPPVSAEPKNPVLSSKYSSPFVRAGNTELPAIFAESALMGDILSREIIFSHKGARRWPIASITKLMTANLASRDLSMHRSVAIADTDLRPSDTSNGLIAGEVYSVSDLLTAMLVRSSNQAAEALARTYGRDSFLAEMNKEALALGMNQTYFDDPSGLSPSNQSTSEDLLKLAAKIYLTNPEIFRITQKPSAVITELNTNFSKLIENTNLFAGRNDFLGGKTGFTDEANGNLLSVFFYRERPVFIVVLGSSDRFGETEKLYNWFRENYK